MAVPVTVETNGEGVRERLRCLERDAKRCKSRHFGAGVRTRNYHLRYGVASIVISLTLGSLVTPAAKQFPAHQEGLTIAGMVLAFLAAVLTALQTFFNFNKTAQGHNAIANKYVVIARKSRDLIAELHDGRIEYADVWTQYSVLHREYLELNMEAEPFPTTHEDHKRSLAVGTALSDAEAAVRVHNAGQSG